MRQRNIVVAVLVLVSFVMSACSGGPTAPTPTPTPGIISSITLAQIGQVDPPVPSGVSALSYVYGLDFITAHYTANINPSDMGPNTIVRACLGSDPDTYISGACVAKGTTAISSGVVEGVTLSSAYAVGSVRISSTAYVHVFVMNASVGQQNAFTNALSYAEQARVPFSKLRESGLLIGEPTSKEVPINWHTQ